MKRLILDVPVLVRGAAEGATTSGRRQRPTVEEWNGQLFDAVLVVDDLVLVPSEEAVATCRTVAVPPVSTNVRISKGWTDTLRP